MAATLGIAPEELCLLSEGLIARAAAALPLPAAAVLGLWLSKARAGGQEPTAVLAAHFAEAGGGEQQLITEARHIKEGNTSKKRDTPERGICEVTNCELTRCDDAAEFRNTSYQ